MILQHSSARAPEGGRQAEIPAGVQMLYGRPGVGKLVVTYCGQTMHGELINGLFPKNDREALLGASQDAQGIGGDRRVEGANASLMKRRLSGTKRTLAQQFGMSAFRLKQILSLLRALNLHWMRVQFSPEAHCKAS